MPIHRCFHLSNKPKATHRIIARIPQSPKTPRSQMRMHHNAAMAVWRLHDGKLVGLLNLFAGYAAAG